MSGLSWLAVMLVGTVALYWSVSIEVDNRVTSDYIVNEVQVNGRDCITIHQYSQVGITCDWSNR